MQAGLILISSFIIILLNLQSIVCPNWNRWLNAENSRKRLLLLTMKIANDAEWSLTRYNWIRGYYDRTPYFEIGYVFSTVMEKYRQMVETARQIKKTEWPLYHNIHFLEHQQKYWLEIYHLANMLHEIPRKYVYHPLYNHLMEWQQQAYHSAAHKTFEELMDSIHSIDDESEDEEEEVQYIEVEEMRKKIRDKIRFLFNKYPSRGGVGSLDPKITLEGEMLKLHKQNQYLKYAALEHKRHKSPFAVTAKGAMLEPWNKEHMTHPDYMKTTKYPRPTKPGVGQPGEAFGPKGQPAYQGGRHPVVWAFDYGWEPNYDWWNVNPVKSGTTTIPRFFMWGEDVPQK